LLTRILGQICASHLVLSFYLFLLLLPSYVRFCEPPCPVSGKIGVATMCLPIRFFLAAILLAIPAVITTAPKPAAAQAQELLRPDQLDQLVAPIAFYPDPLLTEVLMASTYPLEVAQADRWALRPTMPSISWRAPTIASP
jgi:hypothetical protein